MTEQWGVYFNPNRCMGCGACAIACKNRHGVTEADVDWRRVERVGTGTFPDYEELNVSMSCMHCSDPPCEKVCPANAIEKRESDGIVTVDREACIGCHYCGWACPYGAPQYGDDGKMQKCNVCLGRGPGSGANATAKQNQEDPLAPACADECVGGALKVGPISELMDEASEGAAARFGNRDVNVIVETRASTENAGDTTEEGSAD